MKSGALNLESSEMKILVDKRGEPTEIIECENDESHQLVEEFMLLANETVAKTLRKNKLHGIYRVHPEPDPESLEELRDFVALFGLTCGELSSRKEVNKLLKAINGHPLSCH